MWKCTKCTFEGNVSARSRCEICDHPKQLSATTSPVIPPIASPTSSKKLNPVVVKELMAMGFSELHVTEAIMIVRNDIIFFCGYFLLFYF